MKINKLIIGKITLAVILMLIINSCADKTCEYKGPEADEEFPFSCDAGMDVAFLIDYTGSMGGAIEGIKSSISSIASTIVTESGGDYRLSLSIFDEVYVNDVGTVSPPNYETQTDYTSLPVSQKVIISSNTTRYQYLTMMEKFGTTNTATFSSQLAKLNGSMSLGGGIGFPEPGGLLLNEVLNNSFAGTWRTGSITKLAIIVTDATAGGDDDMVGSQDDTYLTNLAATANAMGVQCILITTMAAGTSNYEISLIDNNDESMKITGADFSNIADDIIIMIEGICDNNVAG